MSVKRKKLRDSIEELGDKARAGAKATENKAGQAADNLKGRYEKKKLKR